MLPIIRGMLKFLANFFYPPCCALCGARTDGKVECQALCDRCNPESDLWEVEALSGVNGRGETLCDRCGEPLPDEVSGGACSACLLWPLPLGRVRSVWRYSDRIAPAITALKYGERFELAPLLALWLRGPAENAFCGDAWDLLLPLPSSPDILRKRGFSHTGLIAKRLANTLGAGWCPDTLQSSRPRAAQASLSPQERIRNVARGFCLEKELPAGAAVLLVDDVITTGASVASAARTLIKGGAGRVDAVSVARSVHFKNTRREIYRKG
jgi:ComF family protein